MPTKTCVVCKTKHNRPKSDYCSNKCVSLGNYLKSQGRSFSFSYCVVCNKQTKKRGALTCSKECRIKRQNRVYADKNKEYHREYEKKRRDTLKSQGISSYAILNANDRKRQQRINKVSFSTIGNVKKLNANDMRELKKDIAYLQKRIEVEEKKNVLIENKLNQTKFYSELKTGDL